jgi:hypothetical protein
MTDMTCDRFDDRLPALMEGEVSSGERERLEAHAAACDRCGALLAELRGIVHQAGALPELQPSRDLWDDIAARIEAPVVQLEARQAPVVVRRGLSWRAAAAAAAVLVAVTALATWQIAGTSTGASGTERVAVTTPEVTAPTQPPAGADTPETLAAAPQESVSREEPRTAPAAPARRPTVSAPEVRNAAADAVTSLYDREIASLRRMLETRRAELDTATVRVLEENLTIIDGAIEQSRQALARDPNSMFLVDHLNEALGRKVQLLRTVTLLPSSS